MMRALVLAALVVGCSDPTFTLRFRVTDGPADACTKMNGSNVVPVTQCQDVPMSCAAVVSIRVFNPNTPTSPVISVCQELMMASNPTLCEIAQVSLPPPASPIEAQTLEVEILVYPKNKLSVDGNGTPICPSMVDIGIDGFPTPSLVPCLPDAPCDPTPAVGGIAFYHPGDQETVVELGCSDLTLLNDPVCTGPATSVNASVIDFDTLVSVSPSLAQQLTVSVGQPTTTIVGQGSDQVVHNTLEMGDLTQLTYVPVGNMPNWQGSVSPELNDRCTQVDESNVASRTDTVRCIKTVDSNADQLVGTRLSKSSLDLILTALGLASFPDSGLVIGIVLDDHGNPAGGLQVMATDGNNQPSLGTIQYLSANRMSVGGTVTSNGGIFLSTDLTFGTTFSVMQSGQTAQAIGGLIDGKVTIVVLQLPSQSPT